MRLPKLKGLSGKILFSFLFSFVLLFGISSYVTYKLAEKHFTQIHNHQLHELVSILGSFSTAVSLTTIDTLLSSTARHNYQLAQTMQDLVDGGRISIGEAQSSFSRLLLQQKTGDLGYSYVVDSKGIIVVHPDPNLIGIDLGERGFIQEQLQNREGSLSYVWQKSEDSSPREKVLHMEYFQPWDWIISVTAYRDELTRIISQKNLQERLNSLSIAGITGIMIFDDTGASIAEKVQTGLEEDFLNAKKQYFSEHGGDGAADDHQHHHEDNKGFLVHDIKGDKQITCHALSDATAYCHFHEENLQLNVLALSDQRSLRQSLATIKGLFLAVFILGVLFSFFTSSWLSKNIASPFRSLLDKLSYDSPEIASRLSQSSDEVEDLSFYIATYVDELEEKNIQLQEVLQKEKEASTELRIYRQVFENTQDGVIITDAQGNILLTNPGFERITGYSSAEAIGQNPRLLKSDYHSAEFFDEMWQSIKEKKYWSGEIYNKKKNGTTYPETLTITAITDENGKTTYYSAIFKDLTELFRQQKRIKFLAYHDSLTELPNRLHLQNHLQSEIAAIEADGGVLLYLAMDLDDFKIVNDSLGHNIGDLLLVEFVHRLIDVVQEAGFLARVGGDEFVFTMRYQTISDEQIEKLLDSLKDCVGRSFKLQNQQVDISMSIGVVIFPQDGKDVFELQKKADLALNSAKKTRGCSVVSFTPEMEREFAARLLDLTNIKQGLLHGEFIPYYQPKIDLFTGKIYGLEALARWRRGDTLVSPNTFIPLAEKSGLIVEMAEQIYKQAFKDTAALIAKGHDLKLSVNLSTHQLRNFTIVDKLMAFSELAQLPPTKIELEVTESALSNDLAIAKSILLKVSELGFSLSIDDFGTGYSSLQYLKQFPINTIKIDRSFISGIGKETDDETLISTIILLATQFGMDIVAEGIETMDQHRYLQWRNCNYGQGYLYSPPLDLESLESWLATDLLLH